MSHVTGKPNSRVQTLPTQYVVESNATDAYALYPKSRLISSISPHVVRKEDPQGPRYREGLSYAFLINSVKFPGLARMDSGRLALALSGDTKPVVEGETNRREGLILFSDDDGVSWTQPTRTPMHRCTPSNLGGDRLMLRGTAGNAHGLCFSEDGGVTWSDVEPIPPAPDGRECYTDLCYHPLVEGDVATSIFCSMEPGADDQYGKLIEEGERPPLAHSFVRRYHLANHVWDDPVYFPLEWRTIEGTLTRAADGSLVAALRSDMPPYVPAPSDHWDGILTTRSDDDGHTWSEPSRHIPYGYMHTHLLPLADGRILMTYAARIGELDGMNYHGIEAVVSSDCGRTWDWQHRFILFRWTDQCTHSPQSVMLSDGRIFTIFLHGQSFSWTDLEERDTKTNIMFLGHVTAVIWNLA